MPGGWFTITVLLIILAVAIVVAVRIARRTMRTNRGGEHALFDSHELERRPAPRRPRNSMPPRAIGLQPSVIGCEPSHASWRKTACSTPCLAGPRPSSPGTPARRCRIWQAELTQAADAFNDVTYGERPGTEPALPDDRRPRRPSAVPRRGLAPAHRAAAATPTPGRKCDDGHRHGRRADRAAAVAQRPVGAAGAGRHHRRRHAQHLS